jgi:hypothetical protein
MFTERKMFSSSFVSSAASGVDTVHGVDGAAVERGGGLRARGRDAAGDLRDVLRRPVRATGVDALGREREVEVLADRHPARLEDRQDLLARRAGIRRRLEHHELPFLKSRRDLARRAQHDRQVRLALAGEWRRQGDQDRLDLAQDVVVARGRDQAGLDELPERVRRDVLDVALAAVQLVDAVLDDVDEHDPPSCICEDLRERHADIAGTDDCDLWLHNGARLPRRASATLAEALPSP